MVKTNLPRFLEESVLLLRRLLLLLLLWCSLDLLLLWSEEDEAEESVAMSVRSSNEHDATNTAHTILPEESISFMFC